MSYDAPSVGSGFAPAPGTASAAPAPQATAAPGGLPAAAVAPAANPSSPLPVIALVCAFLLPLAGIVCGHIALAQIKRDGRPGRGVALAAVILGYAFTAVWVIVMALSLMISFTVGS
ncbi:DUF4190 domain-containing protein [Microbacterium sp. Au-Mic1]|uniref:DUF4190 domain-containing protein n=1 Tax=Microbacterium sp. Au-Mic1 TaxID=2906457 RepID=UPI001E3CBE64|nr:DUF4190 domain-containing protein [Microbacterium sp. Au-Mic1]MCE4025443.1 DUF4190 domain-containing protein [Microbacterium sp. Au-Mic1]